jgi:hypothetical protein
MFFYFKNSLKIGDFEKILIIDNNKLVVKGKNDYILIVSGKDLTIDFYDKNEIVLKGMIKRIDIEND